MDIVRRLLNLGIPELDEGAFQTLGRNSGMRLYGKGGGSAPAPDPLIGQAAMENAQLGKEWLSFAKEQFAVGNERQEVTDALTGRVIEQQLESQDKAAKRSDQQWSDYNAMYRPIERMNMLDALGAQNMTDEQVMELMNSQNTNELSRLQAEYDANIAAINEKHGQNSVDATTMIDAETKRLEAQKASISDVSNQVMAQRRAGSVAEGNAAAEAKADVVANYGQQKEMAARQMASMGVNPTSGKFAGVTRAQAHQY